MQMTRTIESCVGGCTTPDWSNFATGYSHYHHRYRLLAQMSERIIREDKRYNFLFRLFISTICRVREHSLLLNVTSLISFQYYQLCLLTHFIVWISFWLIFLSEFRLQTIFNVGFIPLPWQWFAARIPKSRFLRINKNKT